MNSVFFFNVIKDLEERDEIFEYYLDVVCDLLVRMERYNCIVVFVWFLDFDFNFKLSRYCGVWVLWMDK